MTYKTLTVDQVDAFLAQPDCVVLDHRDQLSYKKAHLPDAQPVKDKLLMQLARGNKHIPVLVYCYHGNSSKDLATLLVSFGLSNVYNLEGGWQAWSNFVMGNKPALSAGLEKWLLDHGFDTANINSRIDNGMSAMMQAAWLAEHSYSEELLAAGIDVNLLNDDENNALWFACVSEDLTIIQLLIRHGINMNNRNVNGATCLIYAASAGKLNVVQTLVEAGADLSHTTHDGYNALDSASTIEVLRFLKTQYRAA